MLDAVERRIAEALQVEPRASWRKIARVLGEHERLVARRGTALLESRRIVVAGVHIQGPSTLVRGICHPGARQTAAEALALRPDSTFSYILSGACDVAAEVFLHPSSPSFDPSITPGLASAEALPVLRYFRTIRGWRLGALSAREIQALATGPADIFPSAELQEPDSPIDQTILHAMTTDARMSVGEMARRADCSESTARRRLEILYQTRQLSIRALIEPAEAGLHTEALLWLRMPPHAVDQVARKIAEDPQARYVAAIAGTHQLVADVTLPGPRELQSYLSQSQWAADVQAFEASLVVGARKRGGQLSRLPGSVEDHPRTVS